MVETRLPPLFSFFQTSTSTSPGKPRGGGGRRRGENKGMLAAASKQELLETGAAGGVTV